MHWCHLAATSLGSVGLLFPTQEQWPFPLLRAAFYFHSAPSAHENSNFSIWVIHNLPTLHHISGLTAASEPQHKIFFFSVGPPDFSKSVYKFPFLIPSWYELSVILYFSWLGTDLVYSHVPCSDEVSKRPSHVLLVIETPTFLLDSWLPTYKMCFTEPPVASYTHVALFRTNEIITDSNVFNLYTDIFKGNFILFPNG